VRARLSLRPIGEIDASVMRKTRLIGRIRLADGPARRRGTGRHLSVNGNAAKAVLLAPYRSKNNAVLAPRCYL